MKKFARSTVGSWRISAFLGRIVTDNWRLLPGLLGLILAWQTLKDSPWAEVWALLATIGPSAILALAAVNLVVMILMTGRWWLLLQALGSPVGLFSLLAYRTAANAISYLTPGPHFGGEPFSIFLLTNRQNKSFGAASSSVLLDRLLELMASLVVLALAITGLTKTHFFTASWQPVITLPLLLALLLYTLFTGKRPLSRIGSALVRFLPLAAKTRTSWMERITSAETATEALYLEQRCHLLLANLLSLAHWAGVFAEFYLMSLLLGFPLSPEDLTALVVVARLAFFTPLPAGIGVLETALPLLTSSLDLGSALGVSLCLIIRLRDLVLTLGGLALAMNYLTCGPKTVIFNKKRAESGTKDHLPAKTKPPDSTSQ